MNLSERIKEYKYHAATALLAGSGLLLSGCGSDLEVSGKDKGVTVELNLPTNILRRAQPETGSARITIEPGVLVDNNAVDPSTGGPGFVLLAHIEKTRRDNIPAVRLSAQVGVPNEPRSRNSAEGLIPEQDWTKQHTLEIRWGQRNWRTIDRKNWYIGTFIWDNRVLGTDQ